MNNHDFEQLKKWLARGGVETQTDLYPIKYQLANRSRKD